MRRGFVRLSVSLAAAALIVFGVACDDESTAEKQQTACEELGQLDAAVNALEGLGPTATVGQLKDARNKVKDEADDARRAIREVNESKSQDLQSAVDSFNKAVNDISSNDAIAQALASVQDEVAAVQAARVKLRTDLNCP